MAPPVRVGRYALFDQIAAGGMASIHIGRLVEALGFSRTVAIKRLHAQYAKDPQFVAMFLDEARLAARIRHPNVVPTLDVVSTEDELFLVMEYVAGATLARLLAATPIPPRIACAVMSGALHGLHAAHEATSDRGEPLHLVHRDVSPQNILVGSDGVARLLDFGVAKAVGQIHTTRDGQLKGKLSYMSPEQLHGRKLDRRTDVYAAGVVLWEALVGRRLFLGDSDGATVTKVLSAPIDPPSVARPELGTAFDACVTRALARDEGARYPSARDMAIALEQAAPGLATQTEVAEWMNEVVGEELRKRATRIAEIEASREAARSDSPVSPEADVSSVSVSDAGAVHPSKPRRAVLLAALGLVATASVAAAVNLTRSRAPSAAQPLVAQESHSSVIVLPSASMSAASEPTTPSATTARPVVTAAPTSARHKAPTGTSSCDPPFTYEGGIKTYKPWCYGK